MPRGDQLTRQWKLLKMLQTRGEGIPLAQLSEEMDVAERTIQRDFELLQELGFPLVYGEDVNGKRFWKIPHDFFRQGPFVISPTEAISLLLAERLFEPVAGTHLADGLQSVLDKIRKCIPTQAIDHFADVDALSYLPRFGRTDHKPHAAKIKLLIEAVQSEQTVKLVYRPLWTGGEYETLFDPYGLLLHDGSLFVLGLSHRKDAMRILKVVRIQHTEPYGRIFKRPENFDVRGYFEDSFGIVAKAGEPVEIRVKFTGKAADLVEERIWHETQQLQRLESESTLFESYKEEAGVLLATFRLAETDVFKNWIKSFGEHAEILSPPWLRQEIRNELDAALRRYDA